jgi:putative transposase
MTKDTVTKPVGRATDIDDPLTDVSRSGAQHLLIQAIEAEAEVFLALTAGFELEDGRARFVRHGHGPERAIQTGIGAVPVQRAKVRDRGTGSGEARIRFTSAILPRWSRRSPSLEALLPVLYLRGVSAGDFQEALSALLGPDAPNLSPSVIGGLKGNETPTILPGRSGISPENAMSTWGRMASTCRPGWRARPNALGGNTHRRFANG